MKKSVGYLLITLLVLSLGLTFAQNVSSQTQNLKVLSYTYYVDTSGFLNIVGEVQNTGSTTAYAPYITGLVTVSTPAGAENSPSGIPVWQEYLAPQQKAPFFLEFQTPQNVETWNLSSITDITLKLHSNDTDSYQYSDFKVTSLSGSLGTGEYNGIYSVNGVIENVGAQTAYNITVAATFYNATGTVVAVGTTYELNDPWITPSLAPSSTINFQVYPSDFNETGAPSWQKISGYSLIVQSTGPMLQGIPPAADNAQGSGGSYKSSGGSTSPTNTPTSTTHSSASPNNSSPLTKASVIAVAVVILAVAAVAALLVLRRSKPRQTAKEARKAKKTKSTPKH
jgi:hypothetical protein